MTDRHTISVRAGDLEPGMLIRMYNHAQEVVSAGQVGGVVHIRARRWAYGRVVHDHMTRKPGDLVERLVRNDH